MSSSAGAGTSEQQPAAGSTVEYSLLMPAVAGKYSVYTITDLMNAVGLGGQTNSVRAVSLRSLVDKEGYDASLVLASVLQEELEAAGYQTEVELVPRSEPGQPQRLGRADLPKNPNGQFLLDVVIDGIGLVNRSNGDRWFPAYKLSWRVLRPSGEIVVPTHVFIHGPFTDNEGREFTRTTCGLPSFAATMEKPPVLWDCFDHGLREASRALIPVIREQQDIALHGSRAAKTGTSRANPGVKPKDSDPCPKARRPRDVLDGKCGSG